jgi:hypothetical protein
MNNLGSHFGNLFEKISLEVDTENLGTDLNNCGLNGILLFERF